MRLGSLLRKRRRGFAFAILLLAPTLAFPIDVTIQGGLDNASYDPNDHELIRNDVFTPVPLPIASLDISGEFAGMYDFSFKYDWDTIWRNTIYGDVGYQFGPITFGLGFFLGGGDWEMEVLDAGFIGRGGVEFPEIFFVSASIGSSVGGSMESVANSTRQLFSVKAGYWLPHIYTVFELSNTNYIEQVTEYSRIETTRLRYQLRTELYSKNVPYRIIIDLGLQTLSRSVYETGLGTMEDLEINMFFPGFGFVFQFSRWWSWFFEAELPANIDDFSTLGKYYRGWTGFTFQYPQR